MSQGRKPAPAPRRASRPAALLGLVALVAVGLDALGTGAAAPRSEAPAGALDGGPDGPSVVRVRERDGRLALDVDGEPFVVRGAGLAPLEARDVGPLVAAFADAGGTAFRLWGSLHADALLAAAREHGLKVLVGLDVGTEVGGFDYADDAAVARQHRDVLDFVERHADDPAVLGWILANEPNLAFAPDGSPRPADPRVYDAIGALARDIAARDPNHPLTVAFAFTATLAADVAAALERVPELDIVSFQGYGALPAIPAAADASAPDRPFMITEFGPLGHWEMPATDWGREIEEPSGVKAAGIVERMTPTVLEDATGRLVGAFAFLWGWKQERTPTWYGLFVEGEGRTAAVDELSRAWRGRYPENRAPAAASITLDGRAPTASVRVTPAADVVARVVVTDPEGDPVETRWELRREVGERSDGGKFEAGAPVVGLGPVASVSRGDEHALTFPAPDEPGEYRLFAYARDGHGGVATANVPFLVDAAAVR